MMSPTALIIEDDPTIALIVIAALSKRGYDTEMADTFERGLEVMDGKSIDFIVTDIFLPGIGGIKGIQLLKRRARHIPIIAMTGGWGGMSGEDALEAARQVGADASLLKPIASKSFDEALRQINREPAWFMDKAPSSGERASGPSA